jgi:hypothetical protein
MKVISETYHTHLFQYLHLDWCEVPDEGYFRNVSCTLNSISTFVEISVYDTFRKYFHQVPHTNTNVDIELSVHDTLLK